MFSFDFSQTGLKFLQNLQYYVYSNEPDHLLNNQFPMLFTSTLTFNIVNRNRRLTFKVIDDNQISSNPVSITPSEACSDVRSKKGGSNKDGGKSPISSSLFKVLMIFVIKLFVLSLNKV